MTPPPRVLLLLCLCAFLACAPSCGAHYHDHDEEDSEPVPITCGSIIKLRHKASGYRLHSHQVQWGSGSGQQSVTAVDKADDPNSYWTVKEGHGQASCVRGVPVKCGDTVRLEHSPTQKNLHSHNYRSPLSSLQEVSCFGEGQGEGDRLDDWQLECVDAAATDGVWHRSSEVRLHHPGTRRYLYTTSGNQFTNRNCPRCPIVGQLEIACHPSRAAGADNVWYVDEGIFFGGLEDGTEM